MATDYSGDPAAAQSPSPAPGPENVPIVHLPADGEAANVASANQEWKTLADHIAWLKKPRARVSQWLEAVRRYRNAVLHTRFGVDHMGFPAGQFVGWQEDWGLAAFVLESAAATAAWAGRWNYYIVGSVPGSIGVQPVPTDGGNNALMPYSPWVKLSGGVSGGANNNVVLVETARDITRVDANLECVLEWYQYFASGSTSPQVSGGLAHAQQAGDTAQLTSFYGAGFIFRTGTDTNIQAYYRAFSGAATFVDTGVAPTDWVRCRVEIRGANQNDDGAARVIWYLNGAIVANVAVDLNKIGLYAFFRQWTNGSSLVASGVGPVSFRSNIVTGDTLL